MNNLRSLFIPNVWESITTMPAIIVLACIVACLSKKCNLQFKILALCFVVLYNIPFFGSVMNGFSDVSDRWYYVVILFMIMLGCVGIEKEKKTPKYVRSIFLFIGLVIVCFDIIDNGLGIHIIVRDVLLYVCVLISLYVYECKKQEKLLILWVCILLMINGFFIMGPNEFGGKGYSWAFMPNGKVLRDMNRSIDEIEVNEENEFERIDVYVLTSSK